MKQIISAILILIVMTIALSGCKPNEIITPDDSQATVDGITQAVNANNQFAFELYSKLNKQGNVFFSPYSISTALAMTYEGAKGQTAEEMQSVFHFTKDDATRMSSYASLYNSINKQDNEYKLSTANALWGQKDYPFLKEYIDSVQTYYGGKTTNLDFKAQPEQSRITINNWVEDQTNNKIKDIIPAGAIDDMTRMVLTNAIYFKGEWVWQFEKSDTVERDFYITPENPVKAKIMYLDSDKPRLNYMENDLLQIIELPYKGEELSMLILLPKNLTINDLEESLILENLNQWKAQMQERAIPVYLPKFTFETKYFLPDALKQMGMTTAFVPYEADFSGMDGTNMLYISDIIHQAFIDVNEEGTEAAAATAVIMKATSMGPMEEFNANHPFIFMIQQKATGNILFIGKVADPRSV